VSHKIKTIVKMHLPEHQGYKMMEMPGEDHQWIIEDPQKIGGLLKTDRDLRKKQEEHPIAARKVRDRRVKCGVRKVRDRRVI
jgi:hypothetical protein